MTEEEKKDSIKIVGVSFSEFSFPKHYKIVDIEDLKTGDYVVVEGENNVDRVGEIACPIHAVAVLKDYDLLPKIIRLANEEEIKAFNGKKAGEKEAIIICKQKVEKHALGMKVSNVSYDEHLNKYIFHFTADKRVDFRELVKDLAHSLRAKIELWQIGVRDEAKILDGYGLCGCRLCCSNYLQKFESVTLKMAKDQDINVAPAKLSGSCGRLMCCLAYEANIYKEMRKNFPYLGDFVKTKDASGTVIDRNLLKKTLVIQDSERKTLHISIEDVVEFESKQRPEEEAPYKEDSEEVIEAMHQDDEDDATIL